MASISNFEISFESGERQIIHFNGWHIASRAYDNGSILFVAWAKRGRIMAMDPVGEPGDVVFEFGPTRAQALHRLMKALPAPNWRTRLILWLKSFRKVGWL